MSDCQICCSKFNNSSSKQVECVYCHESLCSTCAKKWLLDRIESDCMFCKKVWNNDFLFANFTKSFLSNEYKNHKKEILFQNEKNLLPLTMPLIEDFVKVKNLQNQLKEITKKMSELKKMKQKRHFI